MMSRTQRWILSMDIAGPVRTLSLAVASLALLLAFMAPVSAAPFRWAPQDEADAQADDPQPGEEAESVAVEPGAGFVPDFEDGDLADSQSRAWEYRPYQVAVWFCLDGSPALNAIYLDTAKDVTRRSELLDPSGWDLTTGRAPSRFRNQFLEYLDQPERVAGFTEENVLGRFDKLMIVCLSRAAGQFHARVREFDVQTQQWGPMTVRRIPTAAAVGQKVTEAIVASFMPIARIDRVTEVEYEDEEGKLRRRDEVVMQTRAVKACVRARLEPNQPGDPATQLISAETQSNDSTDVAQLADPDAEAFRWVAVPASSAPAYIRADDRFLPVIRRTDRKGNLVKLEPMEFTFLTIDSQEEAVIRCSIQSSQRAPLAQRASKRAQKLALVIRPPRRPTTLTLVSRDKEPVPLEGFEIYSRRPGQSLEVESEMLGKTDWRGQIEVPPSEDGLRLIYVKRGSRALKKIPIIPGLYDEVQTTLPNDETRLYAEGVFQGLENEILSLIIQRRVAEDLIEAALKEKDATAAKESYQEYEELESLNEVKERLNTAATDLKFQTSDNRELGYIESSLETLMKILDKEISTSKDQVYLEQIQNLSAAARGETVTQ